MVGQICRGPTAVLVVVGLLLAAPVVAAQGGQGGAPPGPPLGLQATWNETVGFVDLLWQAPANGGELIYRVYRKATLIGETQSLNFTDEAPVEGAWYVVSARDSGQGEEGPASLPASPQSNEVGCVGTGTNPPVEWNIAGCVQTVVDQFNFRMDWAWTLFIENTVIDDFLDPVYLPDAPGPNQSCVPYSSSLPWYGVNPGGCVAVADYWSVWVQCAVFYVLGLSKP